MVTEQLVIARRAARVLSSLTDEHINRILRDLAEALLAHPDDILAANALDLERLVPGSPAYDRLQLTLPRLQNIADDLLRVAEQPSPLGRILYETVRPNGMLLRKVSVPFGVIGIIYEARPNVTFDVFALCLKSGNASVLKGGTDAYESNCAIVRLIHSVLRHNAVPNEVVTLLPPDRLASDSLMQAHGLVDVIIPRGGKDLIDYVRHHATVPIIETGAGVCHTYFHRSGDLAIGASVICNAKTRRVSVCNALDCLLIDRSVLSSLSYLCQPLVAHKVHLYVDEASYQALFANYPTPFLHPATAESYGTEYLSYAMSIRSVTDIDEAIAHIARYGSGHSECIIARSDEAIRRFLRIVDSACVYANVSTAFTDGAQFGFGAEVGISTQKMHARGPMGLDAMTTYKWVIEGNGQIRDAEPQTI